VTGEDAPARKGTRCDHGSTQYFGLARPHSDP
jgi:hypothetical protein